MDGPASPRNYSSEQKAATAAVAFLEVVGALKRTKRTGWVLRGVNDPESVAAHSYRMGIMALLALEDPSLDAAECMRIALCHDLAEAVIGDLVPGAVEPAEKHRREAEAMDAMCSLLASGAPRASAEVRRAYAAYETGASPEALFVKDCDKIDMTLQALEYERLQPELDLSDFFNSTRGKIKTRAGQALDEEVRRRRLAVGSCPSASTAQPTPALQPARSPEHAAQGAWALAAAFTAGAAAATLVVWLLPRLSKSGSRA